VVKETNLPMNVDAVVKELTMQENDMKMYINMGKNYLTIFYPKQTPPETDSKTKIQKTNHAFTKSQKSQESINKKIPKKILKLKKLYQMSSPSNVSSKNKKQMLQKKLEYFF